MSASEAISVPPPRTFTADAQGLIAWRPAFERVSVDKLPGGGRILKVSVDGAVVFDRILSADQAAHLATLLKDN